MRNPLRRLRVALFTPLPPAKTGTADYAAALAEALGNLVSLTVLEQKPFVFSPGKFDRIVYQIGNNQYHSKIYSMALAHPGVVVLHEATVQNLVCSSTWHRGDQNAYLREVAYEILGRDLGAAAARTLPMTLPQPQQFLMLRRLLESTKACIVHSQYAERLVRLKGFRGPIGVIPHGVTIREVDPTNYRRLLGLAQDAFLIGVFGYQRPDKQIWDCLVSFRDILVRHPNARLLILGEQSPHAPIAREIDRLGLQGRILLLGHQPLEDFDGYLSACDVVLNLRKNTLGETSGTMMRAFSFGRPVIVSDVGSIRDLPEDVCIPVPHDRHEIQVISECISWLALNPGAAAEIGSRAKSWVSEHCSWERVAKRYVEFIEAAPGGSSTRRRAPKPREDDAQTYAPPPKDVIREYLARWVDPNSPAGEYFATHRGRLVQTVSLIPAGAPDRRILELGCYMQVTPALRGLLGYGEVRGAHLGGVGDALRSCAVANDAEQFCCEIDCFDCEVDRFPYPDGYFDTVLCCELLEHLKSDPMHMMSEINRVLKSNGVLLLTTPNAASLRALRAILHGENPNLFSHYGIPGLSVAPRHAREYAPREVLRLFEESGFAILSIDTTAYGDRPGIYRWITAVISKLKPLTRLREDCAYVLGQKISDVSCRYPSWLYWRD